MAHVKKNITINAPLEKVYSLARDPEHWADWYMGLSAPEKLTGKGEAGTVVNQSYQLAGMRFAVTNRVLEDHVGPEGAHWRGKIEGPLAGEQDVKFEPSDGKTKITMDIDYTLPGSVLGKFADVLFVERMMGNATEGTLKNLKSLCEAKK